MPINRESISASFFFKMKKPEPLFFIAFFYSRFLVFYSRVFFGDLNLAAKNAIIVFSVNGLTTRARERWKEKERERERELERESLEVKPIV